MGVQINGDTGNISATKADYSGNVTIGGTLTYEDVTNIDSVGLVTAREGIEVGARPGVAASISVDGNAIFSGIVTATSFVGDGTNLTNVGVDTAVVFTDKLQVGDSPELISVGVGSDLKISHADGGDSTIEHSGSGSDLIISSVSPADDVFIKCADDLIVNTSSGAKNSIIARNDGEVELFYNASKKIETTNTGAVITGIATATSFSGIGAITMFDTWGLSGSTTYSSNNYITNDWTRRTGTHGGNIGDAMSESSGVFTFPKTGLYYISMQFGGYTSAGTQNYFGVKLTLSTDGGSSYSNVSNYYTSMQNSQYGRLSAQEVIDVTDASQFKIKFQLEVAANISIQGGQGRTSIFFIRYGDT